MLTFSKVFRHKRLFSQITSRTILEPLNSRALIRVNGVDSQEFLQGLITNDIYHLGKSAAGSMFTMFLNTRGRVLFDAIVYKVSDDTFFLECDSDIEKSLEKHLKMYQVRKKVDIASLADDFQIHVAFNIANNIDTELAFVTSNKHKDNNLEDNLHQTCSAVKLHNNLMIFKDPRVNELGYRIICKPQIDVKEEISNLMVTSLSDSIVNYKNLRYSLGVGEGINELPLGNCFPLECNCDYLHGLSFHKGCYIGQELTARTHHTGVVRKRLMPVYFEDIPSSLPKDNVITIEKNNLGKIRGISGTLGLALLKVDQVLELGELKIGGVIAKAFKPHWWPVVLPKQKLIQKT